MHSRSIANVLGCALSGKSLQRRARADRYAEHTASGSGARQGAGIKKVVKANSEQLGIRISKDTFHKGKVQQSRVERTRRTHT